MKKLKQMSIMKMMLTTQLMKKSGVPQAAKPSANLASSQSRQTSYGVTVEVKKSADSVKKSLNTKRKRKQNEQQNEHTCLAVGAYQYCINLLRGFSNILSMLRNRA